MSEEKKIEMAVKYATKESSDEMENVRNIHVKLILNAESRIFQPLANYVKTVIKRLRKLYKIMPVV